MKKLLANFVWRICKLSPDWGNRVMDFSNGLYDFAMRNNTLKVRR